MVLTVPWGNLGRFTFDARRGFLEASGGVASKPPSSRSPTTLLEEKVVLMHSVTTSVTSPPTGLIRVRGEIDLLAATDLLVATALVVEVGCRDVTLDLGDVSFLDCAGLDALTSCRDRLEASGGRLRLGLTSSPVTRLLAFAGSRASWGEPVLLEAACGPPQPSSGTSTAGCVAGSGRMRLLAAVVTGDCGGSRRRIARAETA
jgi:anti-sigma B factor antagonist